MSAEGDVNIQRSLGRIEGMLDQLLGEMRAHKEDDRRAFENIGHQIDSLNASRDRVQGAWWIVTAFGVVVATIAASITALFSGSFKLH